MARSGVRIFSASYAGVQGADAVQELLAGIPDAVQAAVQGVLPSAGQVLVDRYKALAPVAPEFERHPGQMRESAHVEADNGRALSVSVVVDAEDDRGRTYPAFVEYGHIDEKSGKHVPAKPAFWPAYQETKGAIRSIVAGGVRAGVRAAGGSST